MTFPLIGCADKNTDEVYRTSSAARYADSKYSSHLTSLLSRMDAGDESAWIEFKRAGDDVDGEHSQIYSVACSELMRRDPTFFLRKYLAGDVKAIDRGRRGYEWSGDQGRSMMDDVYARRLYVAQNIRERNRIMEFIEQTTNNE